MQELAVSRNSARATGSVPDVIIVNWLPAVTHQRLEMNARRPVPLPLSWVTVSEQKGIVALMVILAAMVLLGVLVWVVNTPVFGP